MSLYVSVMFSTTVLEIIMIGRYFKGSKSLPLELINYIWWFWLKDWVSHTLDVKQGGLFAAGICFCCMSLAGYCPSAGLHGWLCCLQSHWFTVLCVCVHMLFFHWLYAVGNIKRTHRWRSTVHRRWRKHSQLCHSQSSVLPLTFLDFI